MLSISLSNKNRPGIRPWISLAIIAAMLTVSACAPYQARKSGSVRYHARGEASWYGPGFAGRKTANGERYNPNGLTAAHKTLPLGTIVSVRNLSNDKSVVVRINDRGPYVHGRIIDLSKGAAQKIGMLGSGTAEVEVATLSNRGRVEEVLAEEDGGKDSSGDTDTALSLPASEKEFSSSKETVVASKRVSKSKSKGERPVRKNGVAYLIEQDKGKGGDPVQDDAEQLDANAEVDRIEKKAEVDRIEKEAADLGTTDHAEDVISDAERALQDRQAAPKAPAPAGTKGVKKAPGKTPAKATTKSAKKVPGKQVAKAPSKSVKKAPQKAAKPAKAPAAKTAAPKGSGSSYNADEF